MKEQYAKILGVTPTASLSEIKRAYRKKVLVYHPDRNKSEDAIDQFIAIQEAYEYLIDPPKTLVGKQYKYSDFNNPRKATPDVDEKRKRYEEAKKRYEQQKQREKAENNAYFNKISKGKLYRYFKVVLFTSSFLASLLLVDQFLPTRWKKDEITYKNPLVSYAGFNQSLVSPIITKNGNDIWIDRMNYFDINDGQSIYVEKTLILNEVKKVAYFDVKGNWKLLGIDYSVQSIVYIVVFFLLIPLLTLILKSKNLIYSFLFNFSLYLNSVLIVFLLLSNNRWLHIISLGYL